MGRPRTADPNFKRNDAGAYCFRVPIRGTDRHKWVSTGESSIERARLAVEEAGVDRLVLLHNAQVMTHEAISVVMQGRRTTSADVIHGWTAWIERKVSPNTLETYTIQIMGLLTRCGAVDKPLTHITEEQVEHYVNGEGAKLQTVTVRLAALSSFYRYAQAYSYVTINPAMLIDVDRRNMTVEQLEPKHFEPVSELDYWLIYEHRTFSGKPPFSSTFFRDAVVLGYCCGLRISDVQTLQWASFTKDELIIYVRKHHSGGKRLALPLNDPLIARWELRELIDRLLAIPVAERDDIYVWPEKAAESHNPSRRAGASGYIAAKFRRIGIRNSFHGLRTAFSRRLRDEGVSIENIARAMAHSSTSTTEIYLGKPAPYIRGQSRDQLYIDDHIAVNTPAPASAAETHLAVADERVAAPMPAPSVAPDLPGLVERTH